MKTRVYILSSLHVLLLLTIGVMGDACAQDRSKEPFLEGVVQDFVTLSFVGEASVFIEETGQQLTSDAKGKFQVEGLRPGGYTIHVSHPGYRSVVYKNFQLTRGGVYASFVLRSGKPGDPPFVSNSAPRGQFVIDEDAELIERREPHYPESALKDRVEGTILLMVGVDDKGEVKSAMWKEGSKRKDFLEASREVVQYFKFKPAKVKGKPVAVMVTVPFNFRLADKTTQFPLKETTGPLSIEDIADALSYLGVSMRRFNYELPFKHELKVSLVERAEGKIIGEVATSFGKVDQGRSSLVLYRYEKDGAVEFTMNMANLVRRRNLQWPKISIKGFRARFTAHIPESQLQSGVKVPIYVEALSTSGFNFGVDDPVDKIVARSPRSVAVYVELKLEN